MRQLSVSLSVVIISATAVVAQRWIDRNENGIMDPYENPFLSIEERLNDLISRMTLEEKIAQLGGDKTGMSTADNVGLGIPGIKCVDCPHGVRWGKATDFPVGIAQASTWNPDLVKRIGIAIAREIKAKGRNHGLGPCLNICRDPRGGRTFEGFGEDPYLAGKIAVAYIQGMQGEKVIATPKHYACNNQEDVRMKEDVVDIDERTLREFYLPAFKACIQEGNAWSIMGAYNGINDIYCCHNKWLLRDILKDEWGFKGFVVSDWGACHSTVESANAGLDLEMPNAHFYGGALSNAVEEGSVSEEIIDDAVKRLLRARFLAGVFDPQSQIDESVVECEEHIELALETARESIVLLKNENNLLPLDKNKIKSIAVVGPLSDVDHRGRGGSSAVSSSYAVTPLQGVENKIGGVIEITEDTAEADVAIVVVGLLGGDESEGRDRKNLNLPGNQASLIEETLDANKNTVAVLIGGPITGEWIDEVPAIIEAWYTEQENGNAIADVLFGDYNPGGKLPLTFPVSIEQLPPWDSNYKEDYTSGRGYRWYDKQGIKPLFPFGYGLSYTKFEYSNLKIEPQKLPLRVIASSGDSSFVIARSVSDEAIRHERIATLPTVARNDIEEGKPFQQPQINISVDIKNTGQRKGDEVVQLYLKDVESSLPRPLKELKGFKRITLKPNETKTVNLKLKQADLAFYDGEKGWIVEPGTFKVMVGSSSQDLRLTATFEIVKK